MRGRIHYVRKSSHLRSIRVVEREPRRRGYTGAILLNEHDKTVRCSDCSQCTSLQLYTKARRVRDVTTTSVHGHQERLGSAYQPIIDCELSESRGLLIVPPGQGALQLAEASSDVCPKTHPTMLSVEDASSRMDGSFFASLMSSCPRVPVSVHNARLPTSTTALRRTTGLRFGSGRASTSKNSSISST